MPADSHAAAWWAVDHGVEQDGTSSSLVGALFGNDVEEQGGKGATSTERLHQPNLLGA